MICEVFGLSGTCAQAIDDVEVGRAEGWDAGSFDANANLPARERRRGLVADSCDSNMIER